MPSPALPPSLAAEIMDLQRRLARLERTRSGGYALTLAAAAITPVASTTYYFGATAAVGPSTTAQTTRIYVPRSGTLTAAQVWNHAGATAGSAESWQMLIRLNNATDTTVAAVASASAHRLWTNTALAIPVTTGDYVEIKTTTPAWATAPSSFRPGGALYIEV